MAAVVAVTLHSWGRGGFLVVYQCCNRWPGTKTVVLFSRPIVVRRIILVEYSLTHLYATTSTVSFRRQVSVEVQVWGFSIQGIRNTIRSRFSTCVVSSFMLLQTSQTHIWSLCQSTVVLGTVAFYAGLSDYLNSCSAFSLCCSESRFCRL